MEKGKHVYLVKGWTNFHSDTAYISNSKREAVKKMNPPYMRIVVSDNPLQQENANFSRIYLFKLGVLPFEDANLRVCTGSDSSFIYERDRHFRAATPRDIGKRKLEPAGYNGDEYIFNDISVIPKPFSGLEIFLRGEEGEELEVHEIDDYLGCDYNLNTRVNLACVPELGKILSGRAAIAEMKRIGHEGLYSDILRRKNKYQNQRF